MDADLDTLVTALYVQVDDLLKANPDRAPRRPLVGITPRISDAELVTLAVAQALLGFTSEARWLRFSRTHLRGLFPYLPGQPGYNKRLRKLAGTLSWLIRALGTRTSMYSDDVWIADSTPVECGRSRETAKRSDLAGFAEYGFCASHTRYFWGLRLHLLCTLHGLPIAAAVTGAKADERQVLLGMLDDTDLAHQIVGTTLIADKNYYGQDFETTLTAAGIDLLRPTRKGEKTRPRENNSSNHCGKPSNRCSTPTKANSTSNNTAVVHHPVSSPASGSASSRSPPRSGITTPSAPPSSAH